MARAGPTRGAAWAGEAIAGGGPVTLSIDHEGYRASVRLPEETVAELARDLAQP